MFDEPGLNFKSGSFQIPDSAEQHVFQRWRPASIREFERRRGAEALHVTDQVDDGQVEGREDHVRRTEDDRRDATDHRIAQHLSPP